MDLEGLIKARIKSSDGMYKLFTDKIGGCWVMAQALKQYLGKGELYTVVDEGEVKQIVLMVDLGTSFPGLAFVNAGGVRDASKLLKDLKKGRGYVDPHLRSFKVTDIIDPYPTEELVAKVVAYFKDGKDVDAPKVKASAPAKVAKVAEKKVEPKPVEKKLDPLAEARAKKLAARKKV